MKYAAYLSSAGPKRQAIPPTAVSQVGALCLRDGDKGPQVMMVRSSRGRWIIPKGWPMDGSTDAETARAEAWEEAGVLKGKVSKAPVGSYMTQKRYDDGRKVPSHVSVYRIDVRKMTADYPEADIRKRKWVRLAKAAKKTTDKGLRRFLKAIAKDARTRTAA